MDYKAYRRRKLILCIALFLSLLAVSLFSLSSGPYHVPLKEVLAVLLWRGSKDDCLVLLGIRLPRIVARILVGASMGVAGAVLQGYLRNPLATPFTMGVFHGAMFGPSLAIILGAGYLLNSGQIVAGTFSPYVSSVAFFFRHPAPALHSNFSVLRHKNKKKGISICDFLSASSELSPNLVAFPHRAGYVSH